MASNSHKLPARPADLAVTVWNHFLREDERSRLRRMLYDLFELYLNGYRRFDKLDPRSAQVFAHFTDAEGRLDPRLQDVFVECARVIGLLSNLDVRPSVVRATDSLEAMRKAAVARAVASSIFPPQQLLALSSAVLNKFVHLGMVGVHLYRDTASWAQYLVTDYDVVHPRELFAYPSVGHDPDKACGRMRVRWVTLDYLADLYGSSVKRRENVSKMSVRKVAMGESLDGSLSDPSQLFSGFPAVNREQETPTKSGMLLAVRLCELWTDGPLGSVSEYAAVSQNHVFEHIDYDGNAAPTYHPLAITRFLQGPSWYGTSYVEVLFSLAREIEKCIKDVANNSRTLDRLPFVLLPHGAIHERKNTKEDGTALKFVTYKPEVSLASMGQGAIRPTLVAPHNSGLDIPIESARFFTELMDRSRLVRDLLDEKGRAESAQALRYLDEFGRQTMTIPTRNYISLFGEIYRTATATNIAESALSNTPIPISGYDLGLAGAVVNWENATITISGQHNPIPRIADLHFTTRGAVLRSDAIRLQELQGNLELGLITPDQLKLFIIQNGIDAALELTGETATYRTTVQDILTIVNDGNTPAPILNIPQAQRPLFALAILDPFLQSPEFRTLGIAVQKALLVYRTGHINALGAQLPEAVPDPEDIALAEEVRARTIQQMKSSQTA